MKQDKPTGAQAGWRLLNSRRAFESQTFAVRQDEVRIEKQGRSSEISYSYTEKPEAVVVVPLTSRGQIILIRQYRYAVDDWCWEIPAGGTHDTGDQPLEDVVRKELKEETGATCGPLEYVGWFYSAMSFSDEKCHVYLAHEAELSGEPHTEKGETLEVRLLPVQDVLRMVRCGEMKSGPCALAVLLCEERLSSFS